MQIVQLEISGFRGMQNLSIQFEAHTVIIGPNGCGKTTVTDALALVLGRDRLLRPLSDHDFFGCDPSATARIRLVATIVGFPDDDPARAEHWFRHGRAIERWWDVPTRSVVAIRQNGTQRLCVQVGFAARFDRETLEIETVRYFHDCDDLADPFGEDVVTTFPPSLLTEIGFFLVPARRTWDRLASFESELFRRLIRTTHGIPSEALLDERNRLRAPESPLETTAPMEPLVGHINEELSRLIPGSPQFRLRVTGTDTEGLLQALMPHYQYSNGALLPAGRHGTGLLSLQSLILLLEFGRLRAADNQSFILAVEEPELHLPPALQRRALHRAQSVANQTIVTTHSPHVASFFRPSQICLLEPSHSGMSPPRLLDADLLPDAPNALRKLFLDNRQALVDALLHAQVLVPEGRTEYEFLRLLVAVTETSEGWHVDDANVSVAFGTVVGVVPTHDAAVVRTFETLRRVRDGIVPLVDGDVAGGGYVTELLALTLPPSRVLQLPDQWTIENIIGWIIQAGGQPLFAALSTRSIERSIASPVWSRLFELPQANRD
jgi:energy-coupling factor transporter ATP-binding protein EcfA2